MRNEMENALREVLENNFTKYCKELEAAMEAEPHVFSEKFCKKMDKLIRRSKRPWYSMVSTPMKKVAVIIIAILVFSLTSVMSIRAAREAVIGFFIQVYETFSVVFFGSNEDAPEGRTITEPMPDYEITALPEGYRLVYSFEDEWSVKKRYKDDNGNIINFVYVRNTHKPSMVFDTENTTIEYYTYNGTIYSYVEDGMFVQFVWESEEYVFSLKATNFDLVTHLIQKIQKN